MRFSRHPWRWAAALAPFAIAAFGASAAIAQIPSPPSTVFGSVSDSAGDIPENLPVQGYIGDKLCGTRGFTQFTGEGSAKVAVYFVDVVSDEQEPGCGKDGAEVRVKIGDRFAEQTTRWQRGPVQLDVTFGNAKPKPIPTFTPAPTKAVQAAKTPTGNGAGSNADGSRSASGAVGTIPAGSPGAGSPVPTLKGGVTSSNVNARVAATEDGGGFPLWGVAVLVLGGIAAIGGGVGFAMSRARARDEAEGPDDHYLE